MKTVGIIGGFGPDTTAQFYRSVISISQKLENRIRPPILIYSVPLPYAIEKELILNSTGEEEYVPYLVEAAKILERGGADFLVMPCNTLHAFIDDIRASVSIPVLSIIAETTKYLKKNKITEVALISTASTKKNKLYEKSFKPARIIFHVPSDAQQTRLNYLINELIMKDATQKGKEQLEAIVATFALRKIENVVLACTDLQLLKPQNSSVKIYDTMKILADSTVGEILAE